MVQSQHGHRPPLRSVLEAYVSVTGATYTAKAGDRVIGVNRAGTVTVTLLTAEVRKGRVYTVKDESGAATTNNITVATEGSENIDGSATNVISTNYGSVTYYSDGTNWFTVPLLAAASVAHSATTGQGTDDHHAQAHTLASHSAKAHSDLTGVGTDDHHAEAHQATHNSGGADALKLDDLASPDDNADLNFSTTAHGLVPKGPNSGNFLKDDGTWAAPGGGGSDICARATKNSVQTISNDSWTDLTWETEDFDTDTIHFLSAANLTGTVSKTNSSATLTGSGTAFDTELTVGQMIDVPGGAVEQRVVTAIASATSLTVSSNFANTSSGQTATRNNQPLVANTAGKYLIFLSFNFVSNATGVRGARISKNFAGAGIVEQKLDALSSGTHSLVVSTIWNMAQWDFVTAEAYQNSGANLDVNSDATVSFGMAKVLG